MTKFLHTLSFPEHLWLEFFREFFTQATLMVTDDGSPVVNNFKYEESLIADNRAFDILLESDMKGSNPDILPALVIEDLGMSSMGIALNRLSNWTVSPETSKTRSDLMRASYIFHCCAKDRGESRLLAAIVANAMVVFYDQLLASGFHKLEPFAIGKTVPVKNDVGEVYCNTPVQQVFEYQQTWTTYESGPTTAKRFCMRQVAEEHVHYVRTHLDVAYPRLDAYVRLAMTVEAENVSLYTRTTMDVIAPLETTAYTLTATDVADPLAGHQYVRTAMRVAA